MCIENNTVSVIIPAYNAARFIAETVESVMHSTYAFIEVIIVNDGSTDNTNQELNLIKLKYPEIKILEQENKGVAVARNLAISHASGKYILPLDADDLISPDYIQKAYDILSKNEDVKVVYSQAEFIGDKTGLWKLPAFRLELLARKNLIFVSGLYRKSDYEQTGGYCPEIKGPEDWDFWISMLKYGGKVVRIPDVCFYYRIHPGSKRIAVRNKKKESIDLMNRRHKAFMHKSLGGKLHYFREMSKFFNFFHRVFNPSKVYIFPGYETFDELLYTIPEMVYNQRKETLTNKDIIEICFEKYTLRIALFESKTQFNKNKKQLNATTDPNYASGNESNQCIYHPLGSYEEFSYNFKYKGYFVEINFK